MRHLGSRYRASAVPARLPIALVDVEPRPIASSSRRDPGSGHRHNPTFCETFGEHRNTGIPQSGRLARSKSVRLPVWVDAGHKQRFGSVYVADAGNNTLVQEGCADRNTTPRQVGGEHLTRVVLTPVLQGVRPQPREDLPLSRGLHELADRRSGKVDGVAATYQSQSRCRCRRRWILAEVAEPTVETKVHVKRLGSLETIEEMFAVRLDIEQLATIDPTCPGTEAALG